MAATWRQLVVRAARAGVGVERVAQGCPDDPDIEIVAPVGRWFPGNGTHTLLCHGIADALARVATYPTAPCEPDCHCGGR